MFKMNFSILRGEQPSKSNRCNRVIIVTSYSIPELLPFSLKEIVVKIENESLNLNPTNENQFSR